MAQIQTPVITCFPQCQLREHHLLNHCTKYKRSQAKCTLFECTYLYIFIIHLLIHPISRDVQKKFSSKALKNNRLNHENPFKKNPSCHPLPRCTHRMTLDSNSINDSTSKFSITLNMEHHIEMQ